MLPLALNCIPLTSYLSLSLLGVGMKLALLVWVAASPVVLAASNSTSIGTAPPTSLANILTGLLDNVVLNTEDILKGQDFDGVIEALRSITSQINGSSTAQEAIQQLQLLHETEPANLYAYIAGLRALNLVDTVDSLLQFAQGIGQGESSSDNNNPDPPISIYPKALSCDAPYSLSENTLRSAIYIPSTFTYGDKPPVILFPGTGDTGFTTFQGNFIPLLQGPYSDVGDPVWVNVPGLLLGDAQKHAEFAAYAINYIASITGRNVTQVAWSQGNINTQWAFKYFPSTRAVTSDHVAISADYDGTILANFISPPLVPVPPSILQQRYLASSNFISILQTNDGSSAYVPTTTIYSGFFDEIVEPQQGVGASAYLNDVRGVGVTNNEVQSVCSLQPAGTFYTHEGVLYNPLAFALFLDAMKQPGPGNVANLDLSQVCAHYLTPGLDVGDLLVTENAIAIAGLGILLYPDKVLTEPAIMSYALSPPMACSSTSTSTMVPITTASSSSLSLSTTLAITTTRYLVSSSSTTAGVGPASSSTGLSTTHSRSSSSTTPETSSSAILPTSSSIIISTSTSTEVPSSTSTTSYSSPTSDLTSSSPPASSNSSTMIVTSLSSTTPYASSSTSMLTSSLTSSSLSSLTSVSASSSTTVSTRSSIDIPTPRSTTSYLGSSTAATTQSLGMASSGPLTSIPTPSLTTSLISSSTSILTSSSATSDAVFPTSLLLSSSTTSYMISLPGQPTLTSVTTPIGPATTPAAISTSVPTLSSTALYMESTAGTPSLISTTSSPSSRTVAEGSATSVLSSLYIISSIKTAISTAHKGESFTTSVTTLTSTSISDTSIVSNNPIWAVWTSDKPSTSWTTSAVYIETTPSVSVPSPVGGAPYTSPSNVGTELSVVKTSNTADAIFPTSTEWSVVPATMMTVATAIVTSPTTFSNSVIESSKIPVSFSSTSMVSLPSSTMTSTSAIQPPTMSSAATGTTVDVGMSTTSSVVVSPSTSVSTYTGAAVPFSKPPVLSGLSAALAAILSFMT